MREILFRGFHPNESGEQRAFVNGKWTKGYWVTGNLFLPDNPKTPTQICIGTSTLRISYDVIPETVGQYTGLKDKNGKKIFELDIVECYDKNIDDNFIAIVKFGNPNGFYNWGWQLKPITKTDFNLDILLWVEMEETGAYVEIIGNGFKNPELLRGKKPNAD